MELKGLHNFCLELNIHCFISLRLKQVVYIVRSLSILDSIYNTHTLEQMSTSLIALNITISIHYECISKK